MSLVEQDLIDEYESLQARLVELSSSIGKCREVIDTLNSFEVEQTSIEGKIASLGCLMMATSRNPTILLQ